MRFLVLSLCLVTALAVVGPVAVVAAETHDVKVTASEFLPPDLTIRPGDTVVWKWDTDSGSGFVTVKNGTAQDEDAGTIFSFDINSADKTEKSLTFNETGRYPYFASESMNGLILVKETTPVDVTTWGWLKNAFEKPGAPSPRR